MPHYIENVGNNRQLYKKAYLIEFYADNQDNPTDVFTFSIPPESEELTYSQRKSETKTFGGLHVDEYGIDAVKIVLSGSTVNQSLKLIYRGEQSSKWLTGEEEIYYLRDLIMKYRSIENLQKPAKGRIQIYDLSKTAEGSSTPVKNYWQAFPGDFKISRSDDRPFTYKYSFEFTGVSLKEGKEFEFQAESEPNFQSTPDTQNSSTSDSTSSSTTPTPTPDPDPNPGSDDTTVDLPPGKPKFLKDIMEKLVKALDFVDGINGKVNNVLDYVNQVGKLLKVLGNIMSYSTATLTGIIDSIGDSISGLIDGFTNIVNGVKSVLSLPRTIQLKALNVGLELQNATKGLVKAVDSLSKECRDMFTSEYWEIPKEVLDQYGMSNEEFKDSVSMMLKQAENTANEMAAAAKSSNIPEVTIGNPDSETGEQRIILSYGDTSVMIKDTDTLESLAKKYFSDPDRAIDIATYNSVGSLGDLKPGDIIKIPITTRTQQMRRNLIFARREERDNYGKDIMLSDDGLIMASTSGDYELISGARNLSQAILLRLRESVTKRIRLNTYGIRTNISDPTAGVAYIISSIDLTVNRDPRVASVDGIRFSGLGDYLNVNVDYGDINKADGTISGRV
jgi:hypothetical protein